ncbi:MAG: NAD(P)H-binding protein [Burkholderiaceae bacterium]|nr:NAD(P)H-binding protein [Burkholderiaceae bacterium]
MRVESSIQSIRVLVTGATGKLGRLLVPRLLDQGVAVRALTRQAGPARSLLGPRVEVVQGNLGQPATLDAALQGVTHLFLLSPIDPQLATCQGHAIAAAERAGVQRIVKLSGSAWTLAPAGRSLSGDLHAAVEAQLARSAIPHVVLQPNAWSQAVLGHGLALLRAGSDLLADPFAGARVSYIDARDIADVAVAALLGTGGDTPAEGQPWVLTGDQAVQAEELAQWARAASGRPVRVQAALLPTAPDPSVPAFTAQVHAQFHQLIRAGQAQEVTTTVSRVLGRRPRTVAAWVAEQLAHPASP